MLIQPINNIKTAKKVNRTSSYNHYNITSYNDVFLKSTPSFRGYKETLVELVKKEPKTQKEACSYFKKLWEAIQKEPNYEFSDCFKLMNRIINNNSPFYLLNVFRNYTISDDSPIVIKSYVEKVQGNTIPLVTDKNGENIIYYNSLSDSWFSNNLKKQMPMITFVNPDDHLNRLEFSLTNKSELKLAREDSETINYYQVFYPEGNVKKMVRYQPFKDSETTYYNEDGTPDFFKNIFTVW